MFTTDSKIGDIAVSQPSATRIFHKYGIDFCCGGGIPLAKACDRKGLDATAVLSDIVDENNSGQENPDEWNEAPLSSLIAHILSNYHEPLRIELPRLQGMLDKVQKVHGHVDPEQFSNLQTVYRNLVAELEDHMQKEERILFPMIEQGRGSDTAMPVSVMIHEHDQAGEALRSIHSLTDGYQAPEYACNTWNALWSGFEDLEQDLHAHIHLENNILFPRALAGA